MHLRFLACALIAALASQAVAQNCAASRGEWLKQHHKCLKLFKDAVAEDKQPKSGLFTPEASEYNSCYESEKNQFMQYVDDEGACKNFVPQNLEKQFDDFAKVCFNRSNMDKCGEALKDKKINNIRNAEGATLLMMAAKECDIKAFNYLIALGADVKKWDHQGRGVMHYVAMHEFINGDDQSSQEIDAEAAENQAEIIKKLISMGASVNDISLTGSMPLGLAFANGWQSTVKTLLDAGAKPTLAFALLNGSGIHFAALADVVYAGGVVLKLRDLLDAGVNPNEAAYAGAPLWGLVWSNKEVPLGDTMAVMLLEAGLDANGFVDLGKTQSAFADALRADSPEFVIKAFIKAKVDVNKLIWNGEYFDPAFEAIDKGNMKTLQLLLQAGYNTKAIAAKMQNGGEINAFEVAIIKNNLEAVNMLLKKKPDVNRKILRDDGTTTNPLCLAVNQGDNGAVIKALLAAKANPKLMCGAIPPLVAAVFNQNVDAVRLLVNAKADVNYVYEGTSLLELAQMKGNQTIIDMLKKAGARAPFRGDFVGFCANTNLTEKMVIDAIKDGADVNEVGGEEGWTPLHAAAQFAKDPKPLQVLIKRGAFVNAQTKNGVTPFLLAVKYNPNPAIAKLLMAAGADIDAHDPSNNNWDALQDAVANNGAEVVAMLLNAGLAQGYSDSDKDFLVRIAVRNNSNHRVLITLLKNGFRAEPTNSWSDKPLHIALDYNHSIDIIKVLLGGGAVVDETAMRKARNLSMETKEDQVFRNQVIDVLTKAKKKKR
jgi:ankyrin repeat protein